jgi:small redox-active disulfide protein 2
MDNHSGFPQSNEQMLIQILGIGCSRCQQMETDVREVIARLGLEACIERVKDEAEIMRYGVFVLPALVVNGRVVTAGYSGLQRIEKVLSEI